MDKSTKKLGKICKKWPSEIENQHEIVPREANLNRSEVEIENVVSNIQALPNIFIFSEPLTKTLGSIITSSNFSRTKSVEKTLLVSHSIQWVMTFIG